MKNFLWIQKRNEQESSKLIVNGESFSEGHPNYASLYRLFKKAINGVNWDYNERGTKVFVGYNRIVVSAHFEQKDIKGRNVVFTYYQQDRENVTSNIHTASRPDFSLSNDVSQIIDTQIKDIKYRKKRKLFLIGCVAIIAICVAIIAIGVLCFINQCR